MCVCLAAVVDKTNIHPVGAFGFRILIASSLMEILLSQSLSIPMTFSFLVLIPGFQIFRAVILQFRVYAMFWKEKSILRGMKLFFGLEVTFLCISSIKVCAELVGGT